MLSLPVGSNERGDTMQSHEKMSPLWGAEAIGKVINKNERQTFWLLQNGMLPARKVGALWLSDRDALLEWVSKPPAAMAA